MEVSPESLIMSSEAIFRQALANSQQIHVQSLANLQRRTDELHAQLQSALQPYTGVVTLPNLSIVQKAHQLDATFWPDTCARAQNVIDNHGKSQVVAAE